MKFEEKMLVKEHLRGRTLNYLSTLDDFMLIHGRRKADSMVYAGQLTMELMIKGLWTNQKFKRR